MRTLIAVFAALLLLSHGAYAGENDLQSTVDKALAAGEPAAIVKALEKENYRGNTLAAQQLGFMYRDGKVAPQDYAKARKFLKISAEPDQRRIWYKRGIVESQYALAVMLRDGLGGKADAEDAASWFEKAAEQGDARAQLALAQMYIKSAGIKQNPERAYLWSSIAANSLTDAGQKQAEQIRGLAQKQLDPKKLAKTEQLISNWKPKAS